ncbi:Short-chain dehydrogenase [Persephonella hydrogeniphila]|uniref:Short-chain dehydrogenase n=1 Tax=Persephonella hydrogeniphila TaxID=198703 RepID=A0A285N2L1_9AQUI|nr:SDR family NAD(P)-dependent oxidoreductase [Persephonella hydrogeniphila]SNZ02256.1 Short-chain dehydrogenase [Persephonella hydrogeniphila]
MGKTAVITGVSKGLGKALSQKFQSEGFKIIGISRNLPEFPLYRFIQADLTDINRLLEIKEELKEERIDLLINNAGIGIYESWEDMSIEDLKKVFELNFFSVVYLTKLLLPKLRESRGSIINVSSVAGKLYVPYMGGYCASKYALNAFSDSLRAELRKDEIHILNLIVGRINTGFSIRALGSKKPPETPFGSSPEKFAEAVFKAYKKKKREIVFPGWYRYFILISKLFPSLYDRISYEKWNQS